METQTQEALKAVKEPKKLLVGHQAIAVIGRTLQRTQPHEREAVLRFFGCRDVH